MGAAFAGAQSSAKGRFQGIRLFSLHPIKQRRYFPPDLIANLGKFLFVHVLRIRNGPIEPLARAERRTGVTAAHRHDVVPLAAWQLVEALRELARDIDAASPIKLMAVGFTTPDGAEPALQASRRSSPSLLAQPSAICLRQEFSTHTNNSRFFIRSDRSDAAQAARLVHDLLL